MHFGDTAVDMKGTFCGEGLPLTLFDCAAMRDEETRRAFVTDEEMDGCVFGEHFKLLITSEFQPSEFEEYLAHALPLEKLAVIAVEAE